MSTKKICKNCKAFMKGDNCPVCNSNQFTTSFQGRVMVIDANKSLVAQKLGITVKGEYALKIR